jgi:hypothetical protein
MPATRQHQEASACRSLPHCAWQQFSARWGLRNWLLVNALVALLVTQQGCLQGVAAQPPQVIGARTTLTFTSKEEAAVALAQDALDGPVSVQDDAGQGVSSPSSSTSNTIPYVEVRLRAIIQLAVAQLWRSNPLLGGISFPPLLLQDPLNAMAVRFDMLVTPPPGCELVQLSYSLITPNRLVRNTAWDGA